MVNYEPELMYALDSKNEYSDWKNVYNVSGDDVLYCPICLGRVKLWNGQDPDKTYMKQRCFHHIDGMCSQESRIHFAYKTWLLEKGNKFKVGETIYEVFKSEIEKTLHTKFGSYKPDIIVETTNKCTITIKSLDKFEDKMYLYFNTKSDFEFDIKSLLKEKMNNLIDIAKNGNCHNIRIMEVC